jgi:hypothetical protein
MNRSADVLGVPVGGTQRASSPRRPSWNPAPVCAAPATPRPRGRTRAQGSATEHHSPPARARQPRDDLYRRPYRWRSSSVGTAVRRFAHASIMDSSALKDQLRLLQRATDVPVPAGSVAIRRRHIVESDVDPVAVEQWISRNGGRIVPAPEPVMSGDAQWRPSSRNAWAYVFPSALLD